MFSLLFFAIITHWEENEKILDNLLDIAVRDVNEYSEFKCTYECRKTGRTITEILFLLEEKEKQQTRPEKKQEKPEQKTKPDLDDLIDQIREIIKEPLKTKEYKAILQAAGNNIELIKQKYQIAQNQRKIDNLVGWLITAIQEEYTEPVEKKKVSSRKYDYEDLEKQLLNKGDC